jgi:GR25 family glycosyltransferase involved in LPS biosynthesis
MGDRLSAEEVKKYLSLLSASVAASNEFKNPMVLLGFVFEDDVAVKEAFRRFSTSDLAKIILFRPDMRVCIERNLSIESWLLVEQSLLDMKKNPPWQVYSRFVEEYARVKRGAGGD